MTESLKDNSGKMEFIEKLLASQKKELKLLY